MAGAIPDERPPETVIARLRPHGRALVVPTAVLVIDAGACVWVLGRLDQGTDLPPWVGVDAVRIAVLCIAVLVALGGFAAPVLRYLTRTVTVTTRRVVIRSGILLHTREELMHASGYRVVLRRGALQLLFRSGDLTLEAGGDHAIRIRDVPQARLVQATLIDLVDDATRARWRYPVDPSGD